MNGISSTLQGEIKKSGDRKHREKFKFLAAILITNIMVALLCLPMKEAEVVSIKEKKRLHPNHQMMTLAFTNLVTTNESDVPETAVSLISKDKKVIVEKAWLHEATKSDDGETQFKIEISNQDVERVAANALVGMIAVPYVEIKKKTKATYKQGSKYEVSL